MPSRAEKDYLLELSKLNAWLEANPYHLAYDSALRIRNKLRRALQHRRYLYFYAQDIIIVNAALENQNNFTLLALQQRADQTIGAASSERKALGACMMLLGIALLTLSVLAMTCVIGSSVPLLGFFLLVGGTASSVIGYSIFKSGLQQGMARELNNLTAPWRVRL